MPERTHCLLNVAADQGGRGLPLLRPVMGEGQDAKTPLFAERQIQRVGQDEEIRGGVEHDALERQGRALDALR